jgi:hypothetical protein
MATCTRVLAAALVAMLAHATPLTAQSSDKKRTPPPRAGGEAQTRKPPAPPARAVPRPPPPPAPLRTPPRTTPRGAPHAAPRHAPPNGTYLFPFVPFVDFDFEYRFPYGVYPYSRYGYPYLPYRFVFPPPGCVTTEVESHGSVRLDVPQRDAAVLVDGFYVGLVDDFDGVTEHLNLTPGPHHIELRANGFDPASFDVNLEAGRTITYRTPMQPAGSSATPRP